MQYVYLFLLFHKNDNILKFLSLKNIITLTVDAMCKSSFI